jgi:hypothetical protein
MNPTILKRGISFPRSFAISLNNPMPTIQELREKTVTLAKANLKRMIPTSRVSIGSFIDFSRFVLFGWSHEQMQPLEFRPGLDIRKMSPEDLFTLTRCDGRFGEQARLYHANRGIDTAYGVYIDGELAHMSWIYTAAQYSLEPFQRLALEELEVEIVNCFTLEKFRGLGIYPYAIRFLSNLQFQNGVERVYMMADHKNHASQHGIIKAGLKRLGRITYIRIPPSSNKSIYYRRSQSNI